MTKNDRFTGFLGIAAKAGAVVSGEFSVEQAVKKGKAYLVIVAGDASDNTKKHFSDMCVYRNIPILFLYTREVLGRSIGKKERASVGILEKGIADKLLSIVQEG